MEKSKKAKKPSVAFRLTFVAAALASLSGCATSGMSGEIKNTVDGERRAAREMMSSRESAHAAAKMAASYAAPEARLEMPKPAGRQAEPRFDVDARDLPAGPTIANILAGSGMTSVLTEEAEAARVTITLRDVNWREALEALRDARGFDYRIDGRRVTVDKPAKISRTFEVGYLAGTRSGSSSMGGSSGSISAPTPTATATGAAGTTAASASAASSASSGGSSGSSVSSSTAEDFWGSLKATLDTIVGTDDGNKVTTNPMTGTVYVRASASRIREVEDYLKSQEKAAYRQVLIEAKIVEVVLDDGFQAGINWSFNNNRGNIAGGVLPGGGNVNPGASTMSAGPMTFAKAAGAAASTLLASGAGSPVGLAMQFANFGAMLSFLDSQGSTHVLSSPRIATLNNRKAILKVGSEQAFATGASTSTTATAGTAGTTTTPTVTTENRFSGVSFDVTPQIGADGMITLHVRPQLSNVQQKILNVDLGSAGSVSMPTAATDIQDTDTVIRITDGSTAAIGGLMRIQGSSSTSGLPGFGCIGGECKSGGKKTELVILIKATVIRNEADWAAGTGTMGK